MRATRYSRDHEVHDRTAMPETDTEREAKDLVARGYAHVVVDARGSSASFGTRGQPWSPDEAADYGAIVDWVEAQPWSNGRVAAVGTSYDGNTAELIGTRGRASVKVMVPRFDYPNIYTDIVFPGGIRSWPAGSGLPHSPGPLSSREASAKLPPTRAPSWV
jgi:putative CocE/NonD family hydrolase